MVTSNSKVDDLRFFYSNKIIANVVVKVKWIKFEFRLQTKKSRTKLQRRWKTSPSDGPR